MRKHSHRLLPHALWVLSLTIISSSANAFFDVGLGLGRRNAKWNQENADSTTTSDVLKISAHLDPIPLVPISFGLAAYSETWHVSETDQGLTSLRSYSIVPEVTAWIPIDSFKPYGRFGYSILSAYTGKTTAKLGSVGDLALAGIGMHIGAGLEWEVPVVPMLSIFGELEYANERIRLAKDKVGDVDISSTFKPINMISTAMIIGAKLGF